MPVTLPDPVSDAPLANTLNLTSRADYCLDITASEQLPACWQLAQQRGWSLQVLAEGSNVVLRERVPGLVVQPRMRGMRIIDGAGQGRGDAVLVECQAGEHWDTLVQWTIEQGLAGIENLSLIPGSVGAAPVQNIGAYGVELADVFDSLRAFSLQTGEWRTFSKDQCGFGYRDSVFKSACSGRWLIASIRLRLHAAKSPSLGYADLADRFSALPVSQQTPGGLRQIICQLRQAKLPDPALLPNAGSFFKNPVVSAERYAEMKARWPQLVGYPQADSQVKLAAGWLIEQAGWKGKSVGVLAMHAQQALVLVNHGRASASDVIAFAEQVRQSVQALFAVSLEQEPVLIPADNGNL